jgi:hypothetical protein
VARKCNLGKHDCEKRSYLNTIEDFEELFNALHQIFDQELRQLPAGRDAHQVLQVRQDLLRPKELGVIVFHPLLQDQLAVCNGFVTICF